MCVCMCVCVCVISQLHFSRSVEHISYSSEYLEK